MALFRRKTASPAAAAGELPPIPFTAEGEIDLNDGVIEVNGRKYAAMLNWVENGGGSPREILESSRSGDLYARDLYVVPAGMRAIGFGSSTQLGHKKGMPPLALSIDPALAGPDWTGAFFVGSTEQPVFWICQVQRGVVVDDQIVRGLSESASAFRFLMNTHAHGRIFCPDAWGEPDSIPANLWDVVQRKPKASLRKFGFVRNNLPLLVMGSVLVIVLGGGYYIWSKQQAWQLQLAEQERIRRERRIQVFDTDFPWLGTPHPAAFMESCMTAFGEVARNLPGWNQEPLTCALRIPDPPSGPRDTSPGAPPRPPSAVGTPDSPPRMLVTAQWARDGGGKIAWLRESFLPTPEIVSLEPTGNTASVSREVTLTPREGYFTRDALPLGDVRSVFLERFQNLGIEAAFAESVSSQRPVDNPVFDYTDMAWQGTADPRALLPLLEDIPALVPVDMIWTPSTGEWTVAIRVYHEAKLPDGVF